MKSFTISKYIIAILAAIVLLITASTPVYIYGVNSKSEKKSNIKVVETKYRIDVNIKQNIVIVYVKNGDKYKPIRAMICSAGAKKTPTPEGRFVLGNKARWLKMINDGEVSYGQYTALIDKKNQIYFHSVPYEKKQNDGQIVEDFNALGKNVSLGCIRLTVMDAKWIYDNMPEGTNINIYSSNKEEPLERPTVTRVESGKKLSWDPTDPDSNNPSFKMKPVYVEHEDTLAVKLGDNFDFDKRIIVYNSNGKQYTEDAVKVTNIKLNGNELDLKNLNIESGTFNKPGIYEITFEVLDPYTVKEGTPAQTVKSVYIVSDNIILCDAQRELISNNCNN